MVSPVIGSKEIDLDQIVRLLIDDEQRKALKKWLEEEAASVIGKPYLAKAAVALLEWLAKNMITRAGQKSADAVRASLAKWMSRKGRRAKMIQWVVGKLWLFNVKDINKIKSDLDTLEQVLSGHKNIYATHPELALVARLLLAVQEVREELGRKLDEVEANILAAIDELRPEIPLTPWDEKFDLDDPVGEQLIMTPLRGRDQVMDRLKLFLEEKAPLFILSGPGGLGKTKLALELCRQVTETGETEWEAYFLERTPSFAEWTKFKPGGPCLIVVDYALSHSNREALVNYVRNISHPRGTIKILMIERDKWADRLKGEIKADFLGRSLEADLTQDSPWPLQTLEPSDEDALFAESAGATAPVDLREATGGNPLLALLAGRVFRENPDDFSPGLLSREGLLRRHLDYVRKRMKTMAEDRFRQLISLLVIAALARGLGQEDREWLLKVAPDLGLPRVKPQLTSLMAEAQASLFVRTPEAKAGVQGQIQLKVEPDLVASALLAEEMIQQEGILKGQLLEFVETLLPFEAVNVAQTLALAGRDLVEDEAMEIKSVIVQTVDHLVAKLRALYADFPEPAVRIEMAKGPFKALAIMGRADPAVANSLLDDLRILHFDYPEPEVRGELAKNLFNVFYDASESDIEKATSLLEELRGLHADYPEIAVRVFLATGLYNAFNQESKSDPEKAASLLEELRGLHADYPETAVRVILARGLYNAFKDAIESDSEGDASLLEEIRGLHVDHPELEIRKTLAKGALAGLYGGVALARGIATDLLRKDPGLTLESSNGPRAPLWYWLRQMIDQLGSPAELEELKRECAELEAFNAKALEKFKESFEAGQAGRFEEAIDLFNQAIGLSRGTAANVRQAMKQFRDLFQTAVDHPEQADQLPDKIMQLIEVLKWPSSGPL